MHIHIPPPASKTWGYGKAFPMTVGSPGISTTQRNLFSFNLNDIIKGKGEKEVAPAEDVDVDMDVDMDMDIITDENYEVSRLSAWAKRIPKYQQQMKDKTKSLTNGEQDDESDSTSTIKPSFSLSNLINVEALLLASGQVTLDNEADTGTKLLKDMMRQNDGNAVEDNAEDGLTSSSTPSTANMVGVNVDINNAEDQLSWNVLMQSVQQNMKNLVESPTTFKGPSYEFSMAAELALKEATQSIEIFTNYAASSVSPDKVQSLITSATRSLAVDQSADVFKTTMDKVVAVAETLARDQGVDVSDAAAKARASTKYTAEFLRVANGVLVSGYVRGESGTIRSGNEDIAEQLRIPESDDVAKPLFEDFESVESIADEDFQSTIVKGSEMSLLSGAIYEDIVSSTHDLGYSIVANGTAGDVVWMATDSIGYGSDFDQEQDLIDDVESPVLVRTITFRGYDASDESVDREKLLYKICDAESVPFGDETKNLMVHKGLLEVAKEAYDQVIHSIDMSGPNHKIVLNGHSIGGSIAALVLFLLVEERGGKFTVDLKIHLFAQVFLHLSLMSYTHLFLINSQLNLSMKRYLESSPSVHLQWLLTRSVPLSQMTRIHAQF
jgi:surfactin synthase thioesterase subunit